MPVRRLPRNPDLDHLKYQAQDLLKLHAFRDLASAQRIREFHPRFSGVPDADVFSTPLKLIDAQLAIAREYGFASWTRLREHLQKQSASDSRKLPHHERIEEPVFREALRLLDAGDVDGLRLQLREHPKLVLQRVLFAGENYFRTPTLLEFVAENPVRHGRLPDNIVQMAGVILDAGVKQSALNAALELVVTGRVARECGVQIPLIDLLCKFGADPGMALRPAAGHGEQQAVHTLLRLGARLDLPAAAALGRVEDFQELFPGSNAHERHLALAMASQFGHIDLVRTLLDAGEDPDRYNPTGAHSHSTPLHQAAWAGHEEVVRLLVERGARLDMRDIHWQGTPAEWAEYGGHMELAAWLRNAGTLRARSS